MHHSTDAKEASGRIVDPSHTQAVERSEIPPNKVREMKNREPTNPNGLAVESNEDFTNSKAS